MGTSRAEAVAEREEQALAAAEKLARLARWQDETELPPADGMDAWHRTAAAVANALFDATGSRVRRLPLARS